MLTNQVSFSLSLSLYWQCVLSALSDICSEGSEGLSLMMLCVWHRFEDIAITIGLPDTAIKAMNVKTKRQYAVSQVVKKPIDAFKRSIKKESQRRATALDTYNAELLVGLYWAGAGLRNHVDMPQLAQSKVVQSLKQRVNEWTRVQTLRAAAAHNAAPTAEQKAHNLIKRRMGRWLLSHRLKKFVKNKGVEMEQSRLETLEHVLSELVGCAHHQAESSANLLSCYLLPLRDEFDQALSGEKDPYGHVLQAYESLVDCCRQLATYRSSMAVQVEGVVTAYREEQEAHKREEGCHHHGAHRGDLSELFKSWAVVASSIVLEFLCYQHIVSSNLMHWRAKDPDLKVRMGVMQDTQLLEHSNGRMSMHVLCNEPMQVSNTIPSHHSLTTPALLSTPPQYLLDTSSIPS